MSEKGAWMRDLFDDSNGDDNCLIFLEEKTIYIKLLEYISNTI